MKLNKIIIVSMILLAIMLMGVASATEDLNTTAQDAVVGTGELELSSPVVDEMDTDGDIGDSDAMSVDDIAASTDVKSVENTKEKLATSNDKDMLGDDYEIITPQNFQTYGFEDRVSAGTYKMEGTFTSDEFSRFILFDSGCIVDATDAEFQDIGIILEGGVQISGLTLTSSQYL
ncbi:MAG: hypothetical protein Q4Q14_07460, partial [Methanobrevibacter sp.]|nr:hypothetical protein [Methanobrevibacter sp.]